MQHIIANRSFSIMLITLMLAFMLISTAAAQPRLCPNTYRYVSAGMTTSQVIQACGQPTSKESRIEVKREKIPTEQYFFRMGDSRFVNVPSTAVITIKNKKIADITYEGYPSEEIALCTGSSKLRVGQSYTRALRACGGPVVINKSFEIQEQGTQNVEVWTYDFGPYKPKLFLRFVDGKLAESATQQ